MSERDPLPELGVAHERGRLDFKATVDPQNRLELAKDVAAFANASGGTLWVGASCRGEFLYAYVPLDSQTASQVQRAYEEAVRDRCRPTPMFDVAQHPHEDGFVVGVTVEPMIGSAVGVRLIKSEAVGLLEETYLYPRRVGAHTRSISPDQMHMFVDAEFRRKVLSLEKLVGRQVHLEGRMLRARSIWREAVEVREVDPDGNVVVFMIQFEGYGALPFECPIDLIETVVSGGSMPRIYIPGYLDNTVPESPEERSEVLFFRVTPARALVGG